MKKQSNVVEISDFNEDGKRYPQLREVIDLTDNYSDDPAPAIYNDGAYEDLYDLDEHRVKREEAKAKRWRQRMYIGQKIVGTIVAVASLFAMTGATLVIFPLGVWMVLTKQYVFLAGYGVDDEQ